MSAIASGALLVKIAGMVLNMNKANKAVLTLRATGVAMPERINQDVSKPPARFPSAAVKYGIQPFHPISLRLKWWTSARYLGNQNTKKYHTGSMKTFESVKNRTNRVVNNFPAGTRARASGSRSI